MGTGKKKIEIKKKEKAEDRMVTFSKRKKGLFRKASQLNALSSSQIGIVVFSPAGRPYTNFPMFNHALSLYLASIVAPAPSPDDSGTFGENTSDDNVSMWLNSVENLLLGSVDGGERSVCGGDHHHVDGSAMDGSAIVWSNTVKPAGKVGGTSSSDENDLCLIQNRSNINEWLNSIEVEKIEKLEDLELIKQRLEIISEKISKNICSSYFFFSNSFLICIYT